MVNIVSFAKNKYPTESALITNRDAEFMKFLEEAEKAIDSAIDNLKKRLDSSKPNIGGTTRTPAKKLEIISDFIERINHNSIAIKSILIKELTDLKSKYANGSTYFHSATNNLSHAANHSNNSAASLFFQSQGQPKTPQLNKTIGSQQLKRSFSQMTKYNSLKDINTNNTNKKRDIKLENKMRSTDHEFNLDNIVRRINNELNILGVTTTITSTFFSSINGSKNFSKPFKTAIISLCDSTINNSTSKLAEALQSMNQLGFTAQNISSMLSGAGSNVDKAIAALVANKDGLKTLIDEKIFTAQNISSMLNGAGSNVDKLIAVISKETILAVLRDIVKTENNTTGCVEPREIISGLKGKLKNKSDKDILDNIYYI